MRIQSPVDLGLSIRERRRELQLDQKTLAERVGVSRQWIIDIEHGKPRAEIGLVLRTLRELDIHLDATTPALPPKNKRKAPDLDAVVERFVSKRK